MSTHSLLWNCFFSNEFLPNEIDNNIYFLHQQKHSFLMITKVEVRQWICHSDEDQWWFVALWFSFAFSSYLLIFLIYNWLQSNNELVQMRSSPSILVIYPNEWMANIRVWHPHFTRSNKYTLHIISMKTIIFLFILAELEGKNVNNIEIKFQLINKAKMWLRRWTEWDYKYQESLIRMLFQHTFSWICM